MEEADEVLRLLRWNTAEMNRSFFFPQAYADPLIVNMEKATGLELRTLILHTNYREIHDRSMRLNGGNVTFGFWAPLSTLDYVKYHVRHMEIAINARVQYKIREDECKVYVIVAPWIANVRGFDVDAFAWNPFSGFPIILQLKLVFWFLWAFLSMLYVLEGTRALGVFLLATAGAYVFISVVLIIGRRIALNQWLSSLEEMQKREVEDGFL